MSVFHAEGHFLACEGVGVGFQRVGPDTCGDCRTGMGSPDGGGAGNHVSFLTQHPYAAGKRGGDGGGASTTFAATIAAVAQRQVQYIAIHKAGFADADVARGGRFADNRTGACIPTCGTCAGLHPCHGDFAHPEGDAALGQAVEVVVSRTACHAEGGCKE